MQESHSPTPKPSSLHASAMTYLQEFLAKRRASTERVTDFEVFERDLHGLFAAAEREVVGEELARLDVDVPAIEIEGIVHRRVVRCEETYFTASGAIRVERNLYSTRLDGERAVCPVDLRAGIIDGRWTPLAAKQATWLAAHMTPQEAEEMFDLLGGMTPSKSSLDRLPKHVSERWEQERERFEQALREQESVPPKAVTVAVSLDGVMVPMKDGQREEKRARAAEEGKHTRGPAGHREVGCATLSYYDVDGERLLTLRLARMPEPKKATLKAMLAEELGVVLGQRPDLHVVKVADGAKDNWNYFEELPGHTMVADFYHAAEHLKAALDAAYGETNPNGRAQFDKLRSVLRDDPKGVDKVIRALRYLRKQHPRSKKIAAELRYFRKNRKRMAYRLLTSLHLPIGSGVVEAACKTLVTQRMKRSGMRWRHRGGQAILTFRSLAQSERFDRAWDLLRATYTKRVVMPDNVIDLAAWRRAA